MNILQKVPKKLLGRLLAVFNQPGRIFFLDSTARCTSETLYSICYVPRFLGIDFFSPIKKACASYSTLANSDYLLSTSGRHKKLVLGMYQARILGHDE